jgi:hypothetical protein
MANTMKPQEGVCVPARSIRVGDTRPVSHWLSQGHCRALHARGPAALTLAALLQRCRTREERYAILAGYLVTGR